MYRKLGFSFMFSVCLGVAANAQLGGLGSDIGSGGAGGDVADQTGASGTTGGNQGAQVPIDGGISILVAAGAAALGKKLYKKNREGATVNV